MKLEDAMKLAEEVKGSVELEHYKQYMYNIRAVKTWPPEGYSFYIGDWEVISKKKSSVKSYNAIKNHKGWQVYKDGGLVLTTEDYTCS